MKVLIALLALVAVSQAAFTGSLQQRVQPLIKQAAFKIQLASPGRDLSGLASMVAGLFENQINDAVAAIQFHGNNAMVLAQQLYAKLQEVMAALTGHAEYAWNMLPESIQNLLSGNNAGRLDFGSILSVLGLDDEWATIQGHITTAQNIANNLNIDTIMQTIGSLLQGRGFWSSITGAISSAWTSATGAVSSMWDNMTTVASAMAGAAVSEIQEVANQFLEDAQSNVSAISAEAAIAFQNMMSQYQNELGNTYNNIVNQVGTIVGNAGKPQAKAF